LWSPPSAAHACRPRRGTPPAGASAANAARRPWPGPSRRRSGAPAAAREGLAELLLDGVEVELAQLQQHQPRRAEARHWRHSSLPMLPPAPVISTTLPAGSLMPASSSCTGSRPSRSSGSMSRSRSMRLAAAQFVAAGHGQHRQPGAAASVQRRRRCAPVAEGMATMTCVAARAAAPVAAAASGPSTGTPAMRAPCLAGSSSSRPSTTSPGAGCRPAACAPRRRRPARWRGAASPSLPRCAAHRVRRACGRRCAPRTRPSASTTGCRRQHRRGTLPGPAPSPPAAASRPASGAGQRQALDLAETGEKRHMLCGTRSSAKASR
jgi:hypothetical protein